MVSIGLLYGRRSPPEKPESGDAESPAVNEEIEEQYPGKIPKREGKPIENGHISRNADFLAESLFFARGTPYARQKFRVLKGLMIQAHEQIGRNGERRDQKPNSREVIPGDERNSGKGDSEVLSAGEARGKGDGRHLGVITSYSIHYTKLYERRPWRLRR